MAPFSLNCNHFATSEPQSGVLGGYSTLYILTPDWKWSLIPLEAHRRGLTDSTGRLLGLLNFAVS